MAVNNSGSLNGSLVDGAIDGSYKSRTGNRGGQVEATTAIDRTDLVEGVNGYGIVEASLKVDIPGMPHKVAR